MSVDFRQLRADEEEDGYAVICETVEWLRTKNIKLWNEPLPRPVYSKRQRRGENFGLFLDGRLAAIVSLVAGIPEYWQAEVDDPRSTWLCTLATATEFRGRQLGGLAVERAVQHLSERGGKRVCLDCAPGFLESFYERLGFVRLTCKKQDLSHGPCGSFEAVLMARGVDG